MELITSYDKSAICRTCMQNNDNLLSIFNEVFFGNTSITIAEIISECSKYPVIHNDQLPAQICTACMEAARNAHKFRKQTEDAYCQLKALYDITWVPKEEKISSVISVCAHTTDNYTQTEKDVAFHCETCPNLLERELREHRAGKKCRVCGEKFNNIDQLKVHLSTEHPGKGIRCDFKCNICPREFSRCHNLKRHIIQVHKVKEDDLNINPTQYIKSNAQKCKEYRERQKKKNENLLKKRKISRAERNKSNYERRKMNEQIRSRAEYMKEYRRKRKLKKLNTRLNALLATDQSEQRKSTDQQNETIATTNPFNSLNEELEYHNLNNMDEDVKQFAETIAHPEISIKAENPDDMNNMDAEVKPFGETVEYFEITIKAEKPDELHYIADEVEEFPEALTDHPGISIKAENIDISYSNSSDINEKDANKDDNFEATIKSNKISKRTHIKLEKDDGQSENPTSSTAKRPKQDKRCKECNRTFTRYNHMVRHMLTHSNEKPHVCNICSKSFSRLDNLKEHIARLHHEKSY